MIKNIKDEKWKQLQFVGHKSLTRKYAVSSIGRAASFSRDLQEDGKILNGSVTSGYRTLNLHLENGNDTIYLHREIANFFCKIGHRRKHCMVYNNDKGGQVRWRITQHPTRR